MSHLWRPLAGISILIAFSILSGVRGQSVDTHPSLNKANIRQSDATAETHPFSSSDSEKLIAAAGSDPLLLNNLAARFSRVGQHENAARCLEKVLALVPRSPAYLVNLATVYANLGKSKKAYDTVKRAIALAPKDKRARSLLCDVLSQVARHKEAIACFKKRTKNEQLNAVSASNFAVSLMELGEIDRAEAQLNQAYERFPSDTALMNGLGLALYDNKKYSKSARLYGKLVRLAPKEPQYRYNYAIALLASNKRGRAIEQYNILKQSNLALATRLYDVLFGDMVVSARRRSK